MGSFSGACEIVESKDEFNLASHFRGSSITESAMRMNPRDSKIPVLKVGHGKYLEDDLNQLFKSINIKASSKSLDLSDYPSTESLRQKALKKPLGLSASNSPRSEITETVTLKKALRGLSISHASEMAAMKRLSKAACSPRVSEAERITSLYRSVVVESDEPNSFLYKGKETIFEMVIPEESSSNYSTKIPRIKSANQSTQSSPRIGIPPIPKVQGTTQIKKVINLPLAQLENEKSKIEMMEKEKHASVPSLSCHNNSEKRCELRKDNSASIKLTKKVAAPAPKQGKKGRLNTTSSSCSTNENKLTKITRSNHRPLKPIIKTKNVVKKKLKQDLTSTACSSSNSDNEVNADIEPVKSQMVCQRCQCSMKNGKTESNPGPVAHGSKVAPEICSIETTSVADSCNRSVDPTMKLNKDSKSKDKGEFSQSSKSSLGEYSTSTSASEESNLSRSSCGNRPHMSKHVRWEAIRLVPLQHGNLALSHFNLIKKLGCGDIGTVYLAELIGANCLFAIKVMDNEYLARRKKMPRAQTEREILRMLDHPFLPTLYAQFTSDNLSCLVMEYCPGGDLHVLRQKQPGRNFPEQAARFYVAEVLLALEYLHMLGVVYRDLKPENILVREDGHIMLTDFDLSLRCTVSPVLLNSSSSAVLEPARMSGPCTGSSCIDPFCIEPSCKVSCFSPRILPHTNSKAKKIKAEQKTAQIRSSLQLIAEPTDARSNSFVGTHEYLAPEIIKGDGHGSAVDWWTFGIFLYELLYGKTPFKGTSNEETLANVVLQPLAFPNSPLVSLQARDLIRGLLLKEPENRLGSERGAAEIKQHPFFEGLNWALIRCAIPPELPEIYDYGVGIFDSEEQKSKFLDFKSNGDHLEFELF